MKWQSGKILTIIMLFLLFPLHAVFAQNTSEVSFQGHVTDSGWLPAVVGDGTVGTVGEAKQLQAFQASFPAGGGGIRYCAHVSGIGWQNWASDGTVAGTVGENRAIEAVKIELTNDAASRYDIFYRVHVSNLGWLDWAHNGAQAGTIGFNASIEAIDYKIVEKGTAFSQSQSTPFVDGSNFTNDITYNTHVSNDGWQSPVPLGAISGTVGQGKAAEAFQISLNNAPADTDITYQAHVQERGWLDPVTSGAVCGTTGENLSMQGLKISLRGVASALDNIYYRVHVGNVGWLGWAKNGELAGTEGLNLPIEAVQVVVSSKNQAPPGDTNYPGLTPEILNNFTGVTTHAYVENIGWMDPVGAGQTAGTVGQNNGIEGLQITLDSIPNTNIVYNTQVEDIGWQGEKLNGDIAGLPGNNLQLEAITINLSGSAAALFDVYYQVHSEDIGWLDWAKNGEWAGTTGGRRKMEAINVLLTPKNQPAPGSMAVPYKQVEPKVTRITAADVPQFDLICAIVEHEGGSSYTSALAVMSCVMNRCDSGRWGGKDPVSVLTAPGQFSSYLDGYYKQYLGRSSESVKQAVLDCLNGTRSHPYESFRAYPTSGSVCIGDNWYF